MGNAIPGNAMALARQAFDYFKTRWSPAQAAGLVANIEAESAFRADAVGDGGAAYGICQWHADRQAVFEAEYGTGMKGAGYEKQLQFVNYELGHNEKNAGVHLEKAETAADAGAAVCTFYERPNDPDGAERRKRAARAEEWLALLTAPGGGANA